MEHWFAYKDVKPRPAAAAVLLTDETTPEVLLARRNAELPFMGGHHVFPGGAIDESDTAHRVRGAGPGEGVAIAAAVREVFEETGLLLVKGPLPHLDILRQRRAAVLSGERTFDSVLEEYDLWINGHAFTPAGIWITPPFSPIRFHTRYFLHRYHDERYEEPISADGEIVGLDWLPPGEARRQWHTGSIRLSTPVAFVLQHLEALPVEEALPWLRRTPGHEIEIPNRFELRRGMFLIPLLTPTIPPATHTNCIALGEEQIHVIDPGPPDAEEQQHLKEHLDHLVALGGRIAGVLLTHSHPDHVGAAVFLREHYGAPLWGHGRTAEQVDFSLDRLLEDNEVIAIPGDPGWRVRCLHTPGHDPGHLCFLEETTRTLLCGDMAANPGTIVVSERYGGDMTQYLESLERLLQEAFTFVIPAHGLPLWGRDSKQVLQGLIDHRLAREAKIRAAVEGGAATLDAILEQAYDDTPREAWPLAEEQARAHLSRLGIALEAAQGS